MKKNDLIKYIFDIFKNGNEKYPLISSRFGADNMFTLLILSEIILANKEN